jgi:hypothetical protein
MKDWNEYLTMCVQRPEYNEKLLAVAGLNKHIKKPKNKSSNLKAKFRNKWAAY